MSNRDYKERLSNSARVRYAQYGALILLGIATVAVVVVAMMQDGPSLLKTLLG